MNWTILGIEPTKDKKAIAAAYRAQLINTNPEDKPEEFKALRAAYEEALKLADQTEEAPVRDESPVGIWMERVRALYDDFPRRIKVENWEEILADDVCIALDTRPLAEQALLTFLMQDFYIPHAVWQTFDEKFSWTDRRSELYESYPRDFVDYAVMNGIRYMENLPYDLFMPGRIAKDCDEYKRLYYQATQVSPDEAAPLLEEMDRLSEYHPYGELLNYRLMIVKGQTEQGYEGCRKLAEEYSQDAKLQLEWAAQCMDMSDWNEGERYVRRALELRPDAVQAKQMLATCLAEQGQYEDAKKLIFKLMDAAGGDGNRIYELRQIIKGWNEKLINDMEAELQADPENMKLMVKLGWCYLQNERDSDALVLCKRIDPEYEDQYEYHNLYAKVEYSLGNHDSAFAHLQETEKLIHMMEPDGTEQTDTRIGSLPEKLQLQGSCLLSTGHTEEAIGKYEEALALAPDNPEVLTHMGSLLCFVGNHSRAVEFFEKLTNIMPGSYHGFYLLSQALFELRRDREAFEAVNRALELEGGDLSVYILKIKILIRYGALDDVREILDFLYQHGVKDEINTLWYEVQLLEDGEGAKEKALEMCRALAARVETGEKLEEASKLYFRLLCLEAEHLDATKSEDRAKMLELVEKGLSHDEKDLHCLDYKAWLLKRDDQRDEALAIYHQLEAVPGHPLSVEEELAELYYEDLDLDAEKSLHYYKILIEQNEHPAYLFYAGTCCKYMNDYEAAEKYFLRLQEMNPDGVDGYNGMSYLYDTMKRYEESLEQIDKVIERVQKWEGDQSDYYYHKVRILRRLNRPLEALEVIDELTEKYGNDDIFKDKFDICCQFGLWEQAAEILDEWRRSGTDKRRQAAAAIDFDLFTGKIDEARDALEKKSKNMNTSDRERLTLLMGELDGDESVQMSIWEKRIENRQDKTHELMNMAQVQWWNGHYDKAREYAQEVLVQLDEMINCNKKYEALYRSRRSIVLAILGRFDEAAAELEAVRELPLCETCSYCLCKDADIYEANMEEIRGNWEKALELHSRGAERWHDDMDFAAGARRMRRKGL